MPTSVYQLQRLSATITSLSHLTAGTNPSSRIWARWGGTKVTYFGERGQRLSNFEWPLLGPSIANGKPPVLHASSNITFKVILPERDYASPEHIKRVKAFNKGTDHTGDAEELLSALAIQSAELTQLPTGQQTPAAAHSAARPFVARPLGAGAFGVVMFRFYFSTGDETAVKSPPKRSSKEYSYCLSDWKDEADMLQNISHVSAAPHNPVPPVMVANERYLRNTLSHSSARPSLPIRSWNSSTRGAAHLKNATTCQHLRAHRCSISCLPPWTISTVKPPRLGTAISSLTTSSSFAGGVRMASWSSSPTLVSPKRLST